ncbi:hypothetical protein [Agarivorans sp.]|uniref:hypothetical protein n=1 Tax=Agarivorans sp. TaxID=1872412 RepID=UPI003D032B46
MKPALSSLLYLFLAACLIAAKPNLGGFRPQQICQAALASLQGSPLQSVDFYRSQQQEMQFRLSNAGQTHSYVCQLDGERVLWRRAQDSRWQLSPELRFHFNASAKQLSIGHYLGQAQLAEYSYRVGDF